MNRATVRRQRGVSLIDALIAIVILSFGLVGMARMQGRTVTAATDAQLRVIAMQLADELLNTALVDTGNAVCYTLPAEAGCASAAAAARAAEWSGRVTASLPGAAAPTVTLDAAAGRLTANIGWTARDSSDARLLTVATDVR